MALALGGKSLDLGLETKASPDDSQADQIDSKCLCNCSCGGGGRGGCCTVVAALPARRVAHMWRRDSCWKDRDQHEERDIGRQPHNPWQYDGNEIGMSGHAAALVTTVIARMARRQVAEHSRAGVDTEISTEFPQRWLRQQPCAQAALSSPSAMLCFCASQQGNAIFCAMTTPCFIAMGQREKERERESTALATSRSQKEQRCL